MPATVSSHAAASVSPADSSKNIENRSQRGPVAIEDTAVPQDRGLGTAYERYAFYQRLMGWAEKFGITSFAEGPIDGMAGIRGVHGAALARKGIQVTSVVRDEGERAVARRVYDACDGAQATVEVAKTLDASALPEADMILLYHALPEVAHWKEYVEVAAKKARKALVVTVCNPDNWGVAMLRTVGRLRGITDFEPPSVWFTDILAPELWRHGRVREHLYFDCPWWPDLQVSPGQSLMDRAKRLLGESKRDVRFTHETGKGTLASKFVYDGARWPYFGGPGWQDELMPAILRHPAFDGADPRIARRAAHLHGFVVDTTARKTKAWRRSLVRNDADDPQGGSSSGGGR